MLLQAIFDVEAFATSNLLAPFLVDIPVVADKQLYADVDGEASHFDNNEVKVDEVLLFA